MRAIRWLTYSFAVMFPVAAKAQVRVELGPLISYYRPFGDFEPASP